MRKWTIAAFMVTVLAGLSSSAQAATIAFFGTGSSLGTVSYDGGGGALTGSISVKTVYGIDTPVPIDPFDVLCQSCTLTFTTGVSTTEGPTSWEFGASGPGTFTLTGGISDFGIPLGTTLLTGSVSVATASSAGGLLTVQLLGADVKDAALVAAFGLTDTAFAYAQTEISSKDVVVDDVTGALSGTVTTVTVENKTVPDAGSTLTLLGLGLIGLGTVRRRLSA